MGVPRSGPGSFDDIFGSFGNTSSPKTEKGIPWEAKVIDGQYYVPLRQVGELLKQNSVLPAVRAGIERRVEKGPAK